VSDWIAFFFLFYFFINIYIGFLLGFFMSDFLWHKVSEKEKEDIKKQAKDIMDSFSRRLSKLKVSVDEPIIEREKCERVESSGKCEDLDKDIMFDNAPSKNKDFIIAEKKKW